MRKATENQGNTRTVTEYRSARAKTKGKDHTIQQYLQPNFSSCHQETPMKPSQIQNRLSQPPTRRILPLPNPELSRRDRPGPPWHASNTLGTFHSPVFVHSSPTSTGRPHHARDGLGPPQCFGQPQSATISTTKIDTLANRPQYSSPHPASSQFMRDLSNHSPSSHIRRDQAIESKVTQSHSGSKTVTPKSQELNKAQSSETKFSIPTVQLHRLPVTLSSGSLTMYSRLAPPQQQHKPTSSNNAPIPVVDSSRKKQWDLEHSDNIAKKLCVQGVNSWKAETSKPADRTSLSTSQVLLSRHSPDMKLSPRTTEPFHQSACVEPSSIPKTCLTRPPPMGAKQALVNSCQSHIVKLRSPPKSCVVSFNKRVEENYKTTSSNLSGNIPRKDTSNLPEVLLGSNQSGHVSCNTSVILLKTPSRDKQEGESRNPNICTPRPASKTNSGSQSHLASKRNKTAHSRKRPVVADDVDELFTPDPMTYVVSPTHKMAKPKLDCETVKLPVSDKCCSSGTATSSSTRVNGPTCHKTQTSTVTSPHVVDQKVLFPTVTLVRLKPSLKNNEHLCFTDKPLKNCPIASLGKPLKEKCVKADEKVTSPVPISSNVSETGIVASKQTPMSTPSQSPPLKRQAGEEDPIDVELGLSFALDLDLTQSSHSSEEEQLLSLQEMMERVTKPPDTPEKGAFSEPSTPGHHSCQSRSQPLPSTTNSGIYKNSLDQMLMEISTTKKAKEIETQLLTACKEDLLRIAEYEENQEEGISTEQQEFLQRYSLMSNAIREVPPGEVAFNLEKFGQIFNQDTLQLRQCMVNPQGAAQKTLLWSSPAQLRLHVTIGLFQEAYEYSFCPAQVTRFLFKMMSVNSERLVSEMMLQALCDIACTAAYQRVKNRNQQFKVWVPSLADVTLVLMNMGVAFVTLFPFENLQPSFTEGDLLEDENVTIETPSSIKDLSTFPEHNCNNILKYLSYCMGLCPRAYSDDELLLLLTVMGRIGLDPRLILKSSVELYPLQYKLVNNIRSWDNMLPRICRAYTDLTDDHHNMCQLVQMLPDSTRGRQLRRHLSLSMISKLLDRKCTYTPTEKVFQLSRLRRYLPRMQPSTILCAMLSAPSKSQKDKEDMAILDQQAYYLCYSLLTLANEASNFHFFPAQQKGELLILCSQLETHVKCDIRESEKCLYRSKVKDLVARIYTKWQMLLQRTRPLHGKLYDYWQPLPMDTLSCSQEEQTTDNSDDEEGTVVEEDPEMEEDEQEKDTSESEENEDLMIKEQEEENPLEEGVICDEKLKTGGHNPDNPNQTESAVDPVPVDLKQEMSEVQKESKATDEYTDGGGTGPTEKEAKMIDASVDVTSQHNQVTACDLV